MSTATAALMAPSLAVPEPLKPFPTAKSGYQLKILATNWGFNGSMDLYCSKVKAAGYDGIEIWWPVSEKEQQELFDGLKKYQLEVGFLAAGSSSKFDEHFKAFKTMVSAAVGNKQQKPLYINCHSGKDFFSMEEGLQFMEYTQALSKSSGIPIYHETHRSRLLFAAPIARHYMEKMPGLRITFDVSHWCNVHESLLADQQATLDMAISRADHIHARIGHAEGPQVNDPRAPEWASAVKAHFDWWDAIVAAKKQRGEVLTILTEFGPPDYMPTLPYTKQPLADQWAINVYMLETLRKRYA
ncbi:MAG TPA: sugar phosphate isomerase/epimerase [Chitinophagaceae bacterium]|nr:sugar phosphate isomerase/epimerase [Chitinophagaceae bacterium]